MFFVLRPGSFAYPALRCHPRAKRRISKGGRGSLKDDTPVGVGRGEDNAIGDGLPMPLYQMRERKGLFLPYRVCYNVIVYPLAMKIYKTVTATIKIKKDIKTKNIASKNHRYAVSDGFFPYKKTNPCGYPQGSEAGSIKFNPRNCLQVLGRSPEETFSKEGFLWRIPRVLASPRPAMLLIQF